MFEFSAILFLWLVVFAAAFQQSVSGFGFALVVMPLVTLLLGLRTTAPLVALLAVTLYAVNFLRFRQAIDVRESIRLGLAAAPGVPIGIWALVNVNESLVKSVMGLVLVAYALSTMTLPRLLHSASPRWVYPAGFLAGCLGGAYNTPGPPLVVYGSLRRWTKEEFRAILQGVFLLTGGMTALSHFFARNFTSSVLTSYLIVVPAMGLGILGARWLDRFVDREIFRKLVLVMILLLGVSMVVRF